MVIEAIDRFETDYLFTIHVRNFLMEKAALQMPEAFLKRWLYTINEGKFSMEDIEKDFAGFLKMYEWSLVQKHYAKELNLEVTEEEALQEAKALAAVAEGNYAEATGKLSGYNAAVNYVLEGNLSAAKSAIAGDKSAEAEYLRGVIAAQMGNTSEASAYIKSAISLKPALEAKAKKDVNLKGIQF